jgi:hypothetical protein
MQTYDLVRLERLAKDKCSSLLQKFLHNIRKKFYNIGTGSQVRKPSLLGADAAAKKQNTLAYFGSALVAKKRMTLAQCLTKKFSSMNLW